MRRAVSDSTWELWLAQLEAKRFEGGTLVVEAPGESRAWIETSFARLLAACTAAVLGSGTRVQIVAAGTDGPRVPHAPAPEDFNPRLTFDQFVIGDGNRL